MAGISSKALKPNYAENKYKFNDGNELQSKEFSDGSGLEIYDAGFRMYDPQIGRFHQLDPLADLFEGYSPYVFALNNPILMNDPLGLAADTAQPGVPEMEPVIVTPGNNSPSNAPQLVSNTSDQPAPMPSAMVPFIPSESDFVVEKDYEWYEYFNDHNPGGDFLYELNKFNPLANAVNAVWGASTGYDTYGIPQNSGDIGFNIAGAILPALKLEATIVNTTLTATRQGIAKTLSTSNDIKHILQAKHKLDLLLPKTGGGLNIIRRLYLSLGKSGKLPSTGKFEITVNIYGYDVTIRGAVVNGVPRIGTAFIK
jgi:RHS repeat-associated protein